MRHLGPIKVVPISLDEPLEPLHVEERYTEVLLVAIAGGAVVGQIQLPAVSVLSPEMLADVIGRACGDALWRQRFAATFLAAARGAERDGGESREAATVSVVVCTRDRADQLEACLDSLLALRTSPLEILVVDNCPSDDSTQRLCATRPVRYVLEPHAGQSRARNRGILETTGDFVAFTDDDCVVDPGWLDDLDGSFSDPLVMGVTGYVGPVELESPSQTLFELQGGFQRGLQYTVFDGGQKSPVRISGRVGAGANMILRREAFEKVGLFAEELGPGTPARASDETYLFYRLLARAQRLVFEPSRIVWHRHRQDEAALRRILYDYGVAVSAFATKCVVRHRELAGLNTLVWWWFVHLRQQLTRILFRDHRRLPFRAFLSEVFGTFVGPLQLLRSNRARRKIPPLTLPSKSSERGAPPPRVAANAADPLLSVVIPTHNRREMLADVLNALAAQTYPSDRFETVVVLDGCTDGSLEMARSLELPYALRLLEPERLGSAAKGRNRGAREASNPVLLFVDDDVVPDPEVLSIHARAHRVAPDEHAALGYCPPWVEGKTIWELVLRAWWEDHYRRRAEPGHRWTYTDFASANASLSRSLFLATGFDESFAGRGREDWELGFRLLQDGVRLAYYPRARAWHYLDTRFTTALRQRRGEAASDVLFGLKHPQVMSRLPVAAFLWSVDERWLHENVVLAAEDPARYERRTEAGLPRLDVLAGLHLRGRWRRSASHLLRRAYVLGLVDALGTAERVNALASTIFDSVETLRVTLDDANPVGIPQALGSLELEIATAGSVLGKVSAVDPGGQWDWQAVTTRVVDRAGSHAREAFVLEELERAGTAHLSAKPWPGKQAAHGH
jgi:glycosyltransferase involved in cell wall biosynthesis